MPGQVESDEQQKQDLGQESGVERSKCGVTRRTTIYEWTQTEHLVERFGGAETVTVTVTLVNTIQRLMKEVKTMDEALVNCDEKLIIFGEDGEILMNALSGGR